MPSLPSDYLEKVYAGVLGKLIGVYLGRPFEGWTHQRIIKELGPIHYYVHGKFKSPLVVTDDDVSGTFVFIRALEEHGVSPNLSSEAIGKTWLNNVIEHRSIFWWGGNGISTEHTAWLNLKHGIPAPLSGAIETNGQTVAEQIGAQIFIDGWAMVAPGNPALAVKFAEAAGSVSHDGESVYAAKLLAAMEAEAFVSKDVDHLLDVGLSFVPKDALIARLIADIRNWAKADGNWEVTRQKIEDKYGYDKFCGACHVVPNHGIIILALIYGGHDFHTAMHIINTCGWDTDCNSGNVGCLVAIMHGLFAFDNGPDWRSPLADRALISSADGGYSLNNAARIAYDIANAGRKLAGEEPLVAPKEGAQFHFTLPGSVQGFKANTKDLKSNAVKVEQALDAEHRPGLAIRLNGLTHATRSVEVLTDTFSPPEVTTMPTYELMASPLIYPGQAIKAILRTDKSNSAAVKATLILKTYSLNDELTTIEGPSIDLDAASEKPLEWQIPDNLDGQPIQKVGIALSTQSSQLNGTVWLDRLGWRGCPQVTIKRPIAQPSDFWRRAWVNGASKFQKFFPDPFYISQDRGEGIIIYGTREWTDYRVKIPKLTLRLGSPAGLAVRVRGLNRYYAWLFMKDGGVALVKARDEKRIELVSKRFEWKLDVAYEVELEVEGNTIRGKIGNDVILEAKDDEYVGGGIGLITTDGAVSADQFIIGPV